MKRFEKYGEIQECLLYRGGNMHSKCYCFQTSLTEKQKFNLITLFFESYYNTNQKTDEFSSEFYDLMDKIYKGIIPIEAELLSVECIYDEILNILEDK